MIEILVKILERLGLPADTQYLILVALLLLSVLTSVSVFLWKVVKRLILFGNQKRLNKDLTPYFSRQDVDRATRYFVPTRYQNVSPSEDEEPGRKYIASAKNELIPLFLNEAFKRDGDSNKYYLILADTGMGKTTFLINLHLQYKNQWKNFWHLTKTYDIALFPLGHPDALSEAEKIEDKKNTILLLDAFDEDVKALDNHNGRMNEILGKVQNFREVVITCRTQFFPSQEEEPHFAGYYSFGESGEYQFQKLYLSVFDDKDVKKYLRKRFSVFSIGKRRKAKEIAEKISNLVVRPMILSRIEDLLDSAEEFKHSYQIYEVMIEKWIERESKKRGIREKYGSRENYQKLLYQFSRELALDLYRNKEKRGGYLISKDEKISLHSQIQIEDIENEYKQLSLTEKEARTQSLLNRNSAGQYKFAHKSFFEYFLAKEMFEDVDFLANFDFEGMTAVRSFFYEMLCEKLSKTEGFYSAYISPSTKLLVQSLAGTAKMIEREFDEVDFYKDGDLKSLRLVETKEIFRLEIRKLTGFSPLILSTLTNLKELVIYDKEKFPNLYQIYILYNRKRMLEKTAQSLQLNRRLMQEIKDAQGLLKLIEQLKLKDLLEHLKPSKQREIQLKLEQIEQLEWRERRERISPQEILELRKQLKWMETEEQDELRERLGKFYIYGLEVSKELPELLRNNDRDLMEELTAANFFIKDMKALQEKLPVCRMYY
jgi:hypothetical protein